MKFSVAIPAYKAAFLAEAVASVLAQTWADFELVIVDDASPEDLPAVLAPFLGDARVRYSRNAENTGAENVVDNWNRCLALCRGDYVICMGDDDRLLPTCLADYAAVMETYPDLGVYHARTELIDGTGKSLGCLAARPACESSLEMLLGRWQGRQQYIGDFCFATALLRAGGGFYKLPLAWGSDDISAYRAAKGDGGRFRDGIAETPRPAFQYRISDRTITSGGRYPLKWEAMSRMSAWFAEDLAARRPATAEEAVLLERVR
ncbi:MAG: glycosyltransferase, partial [Bacteroidales bacterium]|nr:glycosyltransferase [Bacteroidales bacterium]